MRKKYKTMTEDNEDFLDEELLNTDSIDNIDIDEENKGLYEHLNLTVDKSQEPLRIDKFLLIFVRTLQEIKFPRPVEPETLL